MKIGFRTGKVVAGLALVFPFAVWAHSAERGLVLLLPTQWYLAGGALAVLASFLLLGWVRPGTIDRAFNAQVRLFSYTDPTHVVTSMVGFMLLVLLLICGIWGSRDPLSNPLPLFTWTGWWVLFTLVQALVGDLWKYFNPWRGPVWLVKKVFGLQDSYRKLPKGSGFVPAVILFYIFAWFELASVSPEDPTRIAIAIMVYWLVNFVAILIYGANEWFARAEPFSIFFRLVGALSPFWRKHQGGNRRDLCLITPGMLLARQTRLPWPGVVFVLLTLSTVSYDGWARTFTWLQWIGVNPLEFPGRSALVLHNTVGLIAACVVLVAVFLLATYLGYRLSGMRGAFLPFAGKLVYSMIPISLAFHGAHYLTQVLVNGQYLILSLNDPLSRGWNLLGLDGMHVTASFLSQLDTVEWIWGAQTAIIVAGHMAGILIAHVIALKLCKTPAQAFKSQIFLVGLMVLYTVFGLWLLSTPAIG